MQSSRSAADPLDPGPNGFAHRGLHQGSGFPENSLIAFAAALELGAGIECDLRLTADNQIVIFHDADAWRICASPAVIGRSTWADLSRLHVGEGPMPTLASLLKLVAGRVPLLLEVKVSEDVWRWVPALRRELAGYPGLFGVMSFDPRISRLLKTNLPDVRRGLLARSKLPGWKRRLYLWLASPDFLGVERIMASDPWVQKVRRRMPVYAWTIHSVAERAQAEVHADALIWEGDGRPRS